MKCERTSLLENNILSINEQFELIKNSKRVTWNTEANSTNSVLKYLIYKGENIEQWVTTNRQLHMHFSKEFFKEEEFVLLHETKGKKYSQSVPEFDKAYKELKEAYNKVEYWTKQTTKQIIPKGIIKINKRPTNQANNFDV